MVRKYFSIRRDYGKEEWLFATRKEQLHVLREAYKEYLKINELPKYEPGDIVIIPYENLQCVDDENCLFGKVDYSKTTYSVNIECMIWAKNEKEADYWKKRFETVSSPMGDEY